MVLNSGSMEYAHLIILCLLRILVFLSVHGYLKAYQTEGIRVKVLAILNSLCEDGLTINHQSPSTFQMLFAGVKNTCSLTFRMNTTRRLLSQMKLSCRNLFILFLPSNISYHISYGNSLNKPCTDILQNF